MSTLTELTPLAALFREKLVKLEAANHANPVNPSFHWGSEWLVEREVGIDDLLPFLVNKLNWGMNITLQCFTTQELTDMWDVINIDDKSARLCWTIIALVDGLSDEDAKMFAQVMPWEDYIDSYRPR